MPWRASCRAALAPRCRCSEGDRPDREAHQPPGCLGVSAGTCLDPVLAAAWIHPWGCPRMSWQEFERLVDDAESDRELRWVLRHCRSAEDLVLAARKLGYRVTRVDLQRAIEEERQEQLGDRPVPAAAEATALTGGWDDAQELL